MPPWQPPGRIALVQSILCWQQTTLPHTRSLAIARCNVLFIFSGEVPELDVALQSQLQPQQELITIPYSLDDVGSARDAAGYFCAQGIPARALTKQSYARSDRLRDALLKAGSVFLVGGNTYEFLAYARRVSLFAVLRQLEARGGIIAAESAGSILLSPHIATASIPSRNGDHNTPRLSRHSGMGRIPFHISPHYEPRAPHARGDLNELQSLADKTQLPVVVLEDGEGFSMRGTRIVQRVGRPRVLRPQFATQRPPTITAKLQPHITLRRLRAPSTVDSLMR